MRRLRAGAWRFAELFTRGRRERELAAELEAHMQHDVDEAVRNGATATDARRSAMLRLGGIEQTKEAYRDRRGFPAIDALLRDLQYAARVLRRNPGFTAVAVLTLALGIGANTAIFSIVNAVLLRPLPFPNASRLVQIFATDTSSASRHDVVSYPDYEDWHARTQAFDGMSAFVTRSLLMADRQAAELVLGARVAPSLFDTLAVHPALGRAFRDDESEPGKALVVVLSDGFWKRHFASDPNVLGSTLRLNDEPHTIVGVMPDGFRIGARAPEQVYVPLVADPNRGHGFLSVVGRLRPGATQAQAQAELDAVARRLASDYPRTNVTNGVNVMPLVDAMAGPSRSGLLMLLAVVGLVLLIACTNVANLLLARGAARHRELRVRAALGAGRGRLIRQLLTESVLLAVLGGALGLLFAQWTGRVLVAILATNFRIPRIESAGIDVSVLTFTLVVALATGVLFGVAPAVSASSPDLAERLNESSRSATGGVRSRRVRHALVIAEFAMALVLLGGAGTLLKTLLTMRGTAPGFNTDNLVVVDMWLPQPKYSHLAERLRFFDTVLDQLRTAPAVRSAAVVANLPLGGGSDGLGFHIAGKPDPAPGKMFDAGFNLASADYFKTMGIPVREGREFSKDDAINAPPVVVINEAAAHRFWPNEPALGRQIILPDESPDAVEEHSTERDSAAARRKTNTLTVVGIVADVHQSSLAIAPRPEFFLNTEQANLPWPWLVLVAKTGGGDPLSLAPTIKSVSRAADPFVPVQKIQTMDDVLSASMAEPRVYTLLLVVFAALAVSLAAIGLYGVISYSVAQRTHELGIRLALGADRGAILRLVLRQGLVLVGIGAAIGLAGSVAVLRALAGLMRGIAPRDPATLALVTLTLLAVALVACYVPARRAARVDPMTALRVD
ncbi:MAG TPA: ABC transporter permease [Vicinamibacterales bacterium]